MYKDIDTTKNNVSGLYDSDYILIGNISGGNYAWNPITSRETGIYTAILGSKNLWKRIVVVIKPAN